jgi:hypothetical protein
MDLDFKELEERTTWSRPVDYLALQRCNIDLSEVLAPRNINFDRRTRIQRQNVPYSYDSGEFSIVAVSKAKNPFKIGVFGSYIGGDANILSV